MNETSREIFENYEIRKTASQKKAFIEYAKKKGADMGYSVSVECKKGKAPRNIVVGSPESAKVIFTAHYDTCPRLPFPNFITPKNILIYILYQLVITVAVIAVPVLVALGISLLCRELGMNEFHYMLIYDVLKAVGIVGILADFTRKFLVVRVNTGIDNCHRNAGTIVPIPRISYIDIIKIILIGE